MNPTDISANVTLCAQAVKKHCPLIHNITNFVVMNITANALLAVGASPLMAHSPEELADLARIVNGVVLNIGTLDSLWTVSMRQMGKLAQQYSVPVVLDPVGAGATTLRTSVAIDLLENASPAVVRGNAGEIMALSGEKSSVCGVDSRNAASEALESAKDLAEHYETVVSVSGETDIITDGTNTVMVRGGSPLMAKVTGMGCTATAITAACVAGAKAANIQPFAFIGAVTAMAIMSTAGENAAKRAEGPGSFVPAFLDALYNLDIEKLKNCLFMSS